MEGWIKLHRKFLKWEWFSDRKMVQMFLYFLLQANHADNKYQGIEIKKGQILTGRKKLSAELGMSEQSIRTCIKRLKSTNEITIKSTSKYSIITICNWETYQVEETKNNQQNNHLANKPSTSNQPASNQQVTTNKNKENKNKKKNVKNNIFKKPSLEDLKSYSTEINFNLDCDNFLDYYESNGWLVGKNKMKDWKATVRTWKRRDSNKPKKNNIVSYHDNIRSKLQEMRDEERNNEAKIENDYGVIDTTIEC